jgi:hypothetical protein
MGAKQAGPARPLDFRIGTSMKKPDSLNVGEPGWKNLEPRHPNRPLTYFANDFLFRAVTHQDCARWRAETCAGARLTVIPDWRLRKNVAQPRLAKEQPGPPILRLSAEIASKQRIFATRQKCPRHPARVYHCSP